MSPERKKLTTLSFKGPSFEDHGVELNVLEELIQYKRILIETAKELWKVNHPERERLPKGFEDSIRIKFYEICPSSAAIPLYREAEHQDSQMQFDFEAEDEINQAVGLIEASFDAVNSKAPLPSEFPKSIIPLFENFGKTLHSDDYIQCQSAKSERPATYTFDTRERIINFVAQDYEDLIDLTGEIRLADLDGFNFALRTADGRKIPGKFEKDHETLIVEALKNHESCQLYVKGLAIFSPKEAEIKKIARIDIIKIMQHETLVVSSNTQPIWEIVSNIGSQVSSEEWDRIPIDFSKNVDHYIYGRERGEE